MACALDFKVLALTGGHAAAHVLCGTGLAGAGDVVQLAFHGHQGGAFDVLWAHALDLAVHTFHVPSAVDQLEVLEHGLNGFEVVIGIHVEHRVVLVIELAVRFGAGVIAFDQIFEVVVMAVGMPVWVHGHKAGVLQKARVNTATSAWEVGRNAVNHVVLKPLKALVGGQVVDRGGRLARIDGAAHHGHGQRGLLAAAGHERHRRQHRHRGLAHAHHMAVAIDGLQVADEFLHVVDVVVQVELAIRQRHQAGVLPVSDVDLVVLQHGLDRVAQQGGVVARQGGHDQHHGLGFELGQGRGIVRETLEAAQLAKRLVDFDALVDGHVGLVDLDGADAELWLFVIFAQTVHQGITG